MSAATTGRKSQEQVKTDNKTIDRMVVAWTVLTPIALLIISIVL